MNSTSNTTSSNLYINPHVSPKFHVQIATPMHIPNTPLLFHPRHRAGDMLHYTLTNSAAGTPGGLRFENEIGTSFAMGALTTATHFIWTTFQETSPGDCKDLGLVTLFIDDMDGVTYASNGKIHVNAWNLLRATSNMRVKFAGVIYHEMTQIWQWNGNGQTPGRLIEGIAIYVRLRAAYAPSDWVKPGEGERWDQGYDVARRFLDYCSRLKHSFVAELNLMMKPGYSADYFAPLIRKSVDQTC